MSDIEISQRVAQQQPRKENNQLLKVKDWTKKTRKKITPEVLLYATLGCTFVHYVTPYVILAVMSHNNDKPAEQCDVLPGKNNLTLQPVGTDRIIICDFSKIGPNGELDCRVAPVKK